MTQEERVAEYMKQNGSITSMDAFRDLSITRLSARIHSLRRNGMRIRTTNETKKVGDGYATYARYSIDTEERE